MMGEQDSLAGGRVKTKEAVPKANEINYVPKRQDVNYIADNRHKIINEIQPK